MFYNFRKPLLNVTIEWNNQHVDMVGRYQEQLCKEYIDINQQGQNMTCH